MAVAPLAGFAAGGQHDIPKPLLGDSTQQPVLFSRRSPSRRTASMWVSACRTASVNALSTGSAIFPNR